MNKLILSFTLFALAKWAQGQPLELELADHRGPAEIHVTTWTTNSMRELGWAWGGLNRPVRRVACLPLTVWNSGSQEWTGPTDPSAFKYWGAFPFLPAILGTTIFHPTGYALRDQISGVLYQWEGGSKTPRIAPGGRVRTFARSAIVDLEGIPDGDYWLSVENDPYGTYLAYAEMFLHIRIEGYSVRIDEPTPLQAATAAQGFLDALELDPENKTALRAARSALRSIRKTLQ
jgi:hypothetical protein